MTSTATATDPTPILVVTGVAAGDTEKILEGATGLAAKVDRSGAFTVLGNLVHGKGYWLAGFTGGLKLNSPIKAIAVP